MQNLKDLTTEPASIQTLLRIMAQLRNPDGGCPWDLEQDFSSIAPYTIEEAYEVADAIDREDFPDLRDELGDLLFQVVFHSQMAAERQLFTFEDVVQSVCDKMIARHPHVFLGEDQRNAEEQTRAWEEIKAAERASKGKSGKTGALDDVAVTLPALMRAQKLQKRAARVGFDWPSPEPVFDKIDEEITEVKAAIASGDQAHIEEEIGDLLFVCVNLARKLDVDAEIALKSANSKFHKRFKAMEALSEARHQVFADLSLEEQEKLWQDIKSGQTT